MSEDLEGQRADIESELSQIGSDLALWRGLLEHPGWSKLMELLKNQEDERVRAIVMQPVTREGIYAQEFMKGEVSMARLFRTLPETALENCEAEIENLTTQMGELNAPQADVETDGGSRVGDGSKFHSDDGDPRSND